MEELNEPKKSLFRRFWNRRVAFGLVGVAVLVVLAIVLMPKNSKQEPNQEDTTAQPPQEQTKKAGTKKENIIKSLGFNLDYYDPATGQAGDIKFFKIKSPYYDKLFEDYGRTIPAESSASRRAEVEVHPTIMLPMGTKVLATIDGIVVGVPKLYSNDYSVQITPDGTMNGLIYELEHVKNPIVKVGDKVKAGDPVAEVTDFSSEHHPGYGYFDLAVFGSPGGRQPQHHCPFLYLDESIKDETFAKIRALYTSWEKYTGNTNLYDENAYTIPGCITTEPIDG